MFLTMLGKEESGKVRFNTSPKSQSQRRAELGVKPCLDSKACVDSTIPFCLPTQGAGLSLISERFITLVIMNLKCIGSWLPSGSASCTRAPLVIQPENIY